MHYLATEIDSIIDSVRQWSNPAKVKELSDLVAKTIVQIDTPASTDPLVIQAITELKTTNLNLSNAQKSRLDDIIARAGGHESGKEQVLVEYPSRIFLKVIAGHLAVSYTDRQSGKEKSMIQYRGQVFEGIAPFEFKGDLAYTQTLELNPETKQPSVQVLVQRGIEISPRFEGYKAAVIGVGELEGKLVYWSLIEKKPKKTGEDNQEYRYKIYHGDVIFDMGERGVADNIRIIGKNIVWRHKAPYSNRIMKNGTIISNEGQDIQNIFDFDGIIGFLTAPKKGKPGTVKYAVIDENGQVLAEHENEIIDPKMAKGCLIYGLRDGNCNGTAGNFDTLMVGNKKFDSAGDGRYIKFGNIDGKLACTYFAVEREDEKADFYEVLYYDGRILKRTRKFFEDGMLKPKLEQLTKLQDGLACVETTGSYDTKTFANRVLYFSFQKDVYSASAANVICTWATQNLPEAGARDITGKLSLMQTTDSNPLDRTGFARELNQFSQLYLIPDQRQRIQPTLELLSH